MHMKIQSIIGYIPGEKKQGVQKEKKRGSLQYIEFCLEPMTYTRKHISLHHAGTNNGYAHGTQTYWYHITQFTHLLPSTMYLLALLTYELQGTSYVQPGTALYRACVLTGIHGSDLILEIQSSWSWVPDVAQGLTAQSVHSSMAVQQQDRLIQIEQRSMHP